MADWLSRDFETATFHLGKPPWSLTTYVVRGTAKLLRCLAEALRSNAACEPAVPPGRLPGHLDLLRNLCTARDRFRLYLRARRHANNGAISICDRFPLPQIRLMDGTRIPDAAAMVAANRLKRWMVRAETKYYEAIAAPELLFVLKIDPARAAARKPDEEASFVIARCQEIWDFDWSASSAHVVDGSRPAQQVLATIKYATWQSL